ncbi:glycoside hydrolase [Achaetomium macrosporum]|uniref:Probable glucan endo-1,3-beta-glucosidase eglC n=1 Tax=Achaetomium macrosporum TaxID=79813 RepID=A0AAN7C0E7_9PEZI|nr:glycoside hydrolase [Achaetomium macrosporum]
MAHFFDDRSPKTQKDFEDEFNAARGLANAPAGGFTSARLYTMVQWQTKQDVISAIPAAIATNTSLLLGIWCSSGDEGVTNELAALKTAINTYGDNFTRLVVGLSVGSEDLYRNTDVARANHERDPGTDPATLVGDINHTSNRAVADAVDWVGMDAYSYWQNQLANAADQSKSLFDAALNQTRAAVGSAGKKKPMWITETGFPVSGHASNQAVPSAENVQRFWREVGCPLFGEEHVW